MGKKGIKPGKKLTVYVRVKKTEESKLIVKTETKDAQTLAANKEKDNKQLADNNSGGVNYVYHTVKKGESIFAISKKYGVTSKTIRALNNLDENNSLSIGQSLKIKEKP